MTDVASKIGAGTRKGNSPGRHPQSVDVTVAGGSEFEENVNTVKATSRTLFSIKKGENHHFLDIIRETVEVNAEKVYASWYDINGNCKNAKRDMRTYEQIWNNAGTIAYHLRCKWHVKKGQRVILCYDFGLHFFEVFFGCLRAGVVAVLVYPPAPPFKKSLLKLAKVVKDCEPALILVDTKVKLGRLSDRANLLSESRHLWPDHVKYKVTDTALSKAGLSFDEKTDVSDLAFLQYTSGSTGEPKGCMVTFRALASDVHLLQRGFYQSFEEHGGIPDEIVGFSWVPQYHDLGLIYTGIAPFAGGWRMHMMSPFTFIKKPLLWIELMSRHNVQWSIAPDFSYGLVARKFQEAQKALSPPQLLAKKEKQPLPALDLSSIIFLTTAAEPCRPDTKEMFQRIFSPYGLSRNWYSSGYGLAENVVGVSYVQGLHISTPRPEDQSKVYVAAAELSNLYEPLILKIVDPETCTEVQGDATGELWIAGPTVVAGYFGKPKLSEETFKARLAEMPGVDFLRTGDLAFVQNGYMYICGRIKDLIIFNGVNHYPQDLEFAAQDASNAVRQGCVAAFTSNEVQNESSVEVVFEIRKECVTEVEQVCSDVRREIVQAIGIPLSRVVAIAERSIPKTTSGKIQRRATREALYDGTLKVIHSLERDLEKRMVEECQIAGETKTAASLPANCLPSKVERMLSARAPNAAKGSTTIELHDFEDILFNVLGCRHTDMDRNWDDIGLSSISSVQLRDAIVDRFPVSLPPDCFELFSTPEQLKAHVLENQEGIFPTKLTILETIPSVELSWIVTGIIQAFCIALLSLLLAASVVPAWYAGQLVKGFVTPWSVGGHSATWLWLPLAVPVWMLAFTAIVIIIKWVIIGHYRAGQICTPSVAYVRWWFVDRTVHLWEIFVGQFLLDTPLLWLFYALLGTEVHPSAHLKAFVREFDLVRIGKGSTIKQNILCRMFSVWEKDEAGPVLRFRPINIGSGSDVKGILGPGVEVGNGAVVESLSVVREGSQVPNETIAAGNPARNTGLVVLPPNVPFHWWSFATLKLVWLFIELYIFFGLMTLGQLMLNGSFLSDWYFAPLCYWFALLSQLAISSTLTSLFLKWILIGKRRPGPYQETLWSNFSEWAADYHYRIGTVALRTCLMFSIMWNIILKMLGMDVDMASTIVPAGVVPSNVDLISVKHSFVALSEFDAKEGGCFSRIQICDGSTIGRNARIGPGVTVSRATVAPLTNVTNSYVQEVTEDRSVAAPSISHIVIRELWIIILYISCLFGICLSLVPSYVLWMKARTFPSFAGVLALAGSLLLGTIFVLLLLSLLQFAAHASSGSANQLESAPMIALETVSVSMPHLVENWSLVSLLWGTPMFNIMVRMQGATVEGFMLYLGSHLCDTSRFTFADRTVIDHSITNGHYYQYGKVTVGPCKLSGVLHRHSFAMANSVVTATESGPSRVLFSAAMENCSIMILDETDKTADEMNVHGNCQELIVPANLSTGVVPYGRDD